MTNTKFEQKCGEEKNADMGAKTPSSNSTTKASCAEELASALMGRASFYETLASLYFKPLSQEQIDAMAASDFSAYAQTNEFFSAGFNDITRYLRKRNSGTRQNLAVDFTTAFGGVGTYEGKTAVPYKSVFTSDEGLMFQEGYQEVFQALKNESVKLRDGLDWPCDHISFMFQFMALQSRRINSALELGNIEEALRLIENSQEFLGKHILSWFSTFVDLALKLLKTRFYRGVLEITQGFLDLDKETLADMQSVVSEEAQSAA